MAAWGLNLLRFVPASLGIVLWGVAAAALVPAIGEALGRGLERLGEGLRDLLWARIAFAASGALVVLLLDDRTWFTGDFLIRAGAATWSGLEANFEQSLPLEILLFERLPRAIHSIWPGSSPLLVPRLLGALSAFFLGLAGAEAGRALARNGAIVVTTAILVAFGGQLVAFTGLGKPAAMLCAITALSGVLALRAEVGRHGHWALGFLGLTVGLALLLHRSALLLLPCWLAVTLGVLRRGRAVRTRADVLWLLFAAAPIAALGVTGARLAGILMGFDLPHHVAGTSMTESAAAWSRATALPRIADILNALMVLVPAGLPLLVLGGRPAAAPGARATHVAVWLAAPWLVALALVRPQQGAFRDLDVFAPGGGALALLCACVLARWSGPPRAFQHVSAAIVTGTLAATLALLACFHDPRGGLARVRAYATETPARPPAERARTWDFLALRGFALRDWPMAAEAAHQAVRNTPSPRLLLMWAIASTYTGRYGDARAAYSAVLERTPSEPTAWVGLAGIALRLGDRTLADSAFARLQTYAPDSPEARQVRTLVRFHPVVLPLARE
jgi:hypothetical protein